MRVGYIDSVVVVVVAASVVVYYWIASAWFAIAQRAPA